MSLKNVILRHLIAYFDTKTILIDKQTESQELHRMMPARTAVADIIDEFIHFGDLVTELRPSPSSREEYQRCVTELSYKACSIAEILYV